MSRRLDELTPDDCTLSFTDKNGNYARRDLPYTGRPLSDKQIVWDWETLLDKKTIKVSSTAVYDGDLVWRAHVVDIPEGLAVTVHEATYALGLQLGETPEEMKAGLWCYGQSPESGYAVFIRALRGFTEATPLSGFRGRENLNSFNARALTAGVATELTHGKHALAVAFYASPKPQAAEVLVQLTQSPPAELGEFIRNAFEN